MSSMPILEITDDGLTDYSTELEKQKSLQTELIEAVSHGKAPAKEYLIMVEHKPVYTLGKHGHAENMLLSDEEMKRLGVECFRTGRGGDITFHGPGQLVAYPIISLQAHKLGVKDYVNLLEESVIQTLLAYGIKGERVDGATGVWIDKDTPKERKICAIGVKCNRFVTMHGLALNVNTDLSWFSRINPCGFVDKGVTSVEKELGHPVDIKELKSTFSAIFSKLLSEKH